MNLTPLLVALAIGCQPAAGLAQAMFKCAGRAGTPVYQDGPCPPGTELRDFQADPATVSVVPLGPAPGSSNRVTAPRLGAKDPASRVPATKTKPERAGDPAGRRHLHPGMGEGEVLARIGAPDLRGSGRGRGQSRWTYMPIAGDEQTVTTVHFEFGKIVEVERKVVR